MNKQYKAHEAARRAQVIVDRWMQGDISRSDLAKEFDTTKGTLDQLFYRLRKAGHPIPRRAPGRGGGWLDPVPEYPIVIEPGDQWAGVQIAERKSHGNGNQEKSPAESDGEDQRVE
jgi:hypothetical protein